MDTLNVYVWEGVCCDYTDGIVIAVAGSVREALELVKEQSSYAYSQVKGIDPVILGGRKRAIVVSGGS